MAIDRIKWPPEGRLGFCTKGEFRECYALVVAEAGDRWIVYISAMPDHHGAVAKADDFSTVDEVIEQVLYEDLGIVWVAADQEAELERQVFDIRHHWPKPR
jgi:hypothetical protein